MRPRVLALLFAAPTLAACATKRDVRDLNTEVQALRASQEASMQAIRREIQRQNEMLLDSLSLKDTRLRGDLMNRLVQLERQLVQIQELSGQSQQGLATLRQELRQRDEEARRAVAAAADTAGGASRPAPTPAGDPDDLFSSAQAALQRGSYTAARAGFEEFVRSFPQHSRAAEAQLGIGETYEKARDATRALESYQRVLELYPGSTKAPTALYRAAGLERERGNAARARTMLNQLVVAYPKSPEAAKAKTDLAAKR